MAYHMIIPNNSNPDDLLLDHYLGSATSINFYWESIGRKLNLPTISTLTELADSEEGFALSAENLISFRNELAMLEKYWANENSTTDLPDGFLLGIRTIMDGINNAVENGLTVMIA